MYTGQQTGEGDRIEERVNLGSASTQLKQPCGPKKIAPWKKGKATKMFVDLITLTEGDLLDINETIREVANDVL